VRSRASAAPPPRLGHPRRGRGATGPSRPAPAAAGGPSAQQALELVRSKPGITIAEMADAMGIKQNYLYRVVPELAKQGLVSKSGKGWHVRDVT
jgi:CRP-like cAMP-binding protein